MTAPIKKLIDQDREDRAGASASRRGLARPQPGRWAQAMNLGLFLAGLVIIAIVINFFARREDLRVQIDATKTRAYSLSDQTRQLLSTLQGDWKIALVMNQDKSNRAIRRQIDEVLKRYTAASPHLSVVRIDPSSPASLGDYDATLAELNEVYKDQIAQYDRALDSGVETFSALLLFAQQQSAVLDQVVSRVPAGDPSKSTLQQESGRLAMLSQEGDVVTAQVQKARRIQQDRPIADYETARSILAQGLGQWAGELNDVAEIFGKWMALPNAEAAVKQFATKAHQEYQSMSQRLAEAADPLKRLPPMELSAIGTQLQNGEAALIIGPHKAAVIPSALLFPKSNIQQKEDGGVSFDQRFRGEHLISAAIRSLTIERMPLVVFVHAEEASMLRPREKQADLVGVASMLKASRYDIAEWMVASQPDPPSAAKGQPVVWVIVPPAQRAGLQISKAEQALLMATARLIEDGQPVLLSVYPSLMPRYGQPDPWTSLAEPFGLAVDTAQVIFERVRVSEDQMQNRLAQLVNEYPDDHVIARALGGDDCKFTLPVPIRMMNAPQPEIARSAVAVVRPSSDRWLEKQWNADPSRVIEPSADQIVREPVAVVMAAQRPNPTQHEAQRIVVVGAGGWMLSYDADLVVSVGGGRTALVYPGNDDLLLASASWLAGMDDLIAASPMSQEVSRLRDITPEMRAMWFWVIVAGLPIFCAVLGVWVWFVRRS